MYTSACKMSIKVKLERVEINSEGLFLFVCTMSDSKVPYFTNPVICQTYLFKTYYDKEALSDISGFAVMALLI